MVAAAKELAAAAAVSPGSPTATPSTFPSADSPALAAAQPSVALPSPLRSGADSEPRQSVSAAAEARARRSGLAAPSSVAEWLQVLELPQYLDAFVREEVLPLSK
jgi:hypothetical protein